MAALVSANSSFNHDHRTMVALMLLAAQWAVSSVIIISVQEIFVKIVELGRRHRRRRRHRRDLGFQLAYHSSSVLVQILLQDYYSLGGLWLWSMCS